MADIGRNSWSEREYCLYSTVFPWNKTEFTA